MKKILYIDMDGVLVDFKNEIDLHFKFQPALKKEFYHNPDEIKGIFLNPKPIEGSIFSVNRLEESGKFDLYIATSATWGNVESAMHKRIWIEKHFGNLFKKKMMITHRKDLLIGDYLIDDREANGAKYFSGELLPFGWSYEEKKWNKFPTWESILDYLL